MHGCRRSEFQPLLVLGLLTGKLEIGPMTVQVKNEPMTVQVKEVIVWALPRWQPDLATKHHGARGGDGKCDGSCLDGR